MGRLDGAQGRSRLPVPGTRFENKQPQNATIPLFFVEAIVSLMVDSLKLGGQEVGSHWQLQLSCRARGRLNCPERPRGGWAPRLGWDPGRLQMEARPSSHPTAEILFPRVAQERHVQCYCRALPFLHRVPRAQDEYSGSMSPPCPGPSPLSLVFHANCFHLLLPYVPLQLLCFPFPLCLAASFSLLLPGFPFLCSESSPQKRVKGEKRCT